jgi:hypothetical protein
VKGISVFGTAVGAVTMNVRNGGVGSGIQVLLSGGAATAANEVSTRFLVLVSGDELRCTTPAGAAAHVAIGGAELLL